MRTIIGFIAGALTAITGLYVLGVNNRKNNDFDECFQDDDIPDDVKKNISIVKTVEGETFTECMNQIVSFFNKIKGSFKISKISLFVDGTSENSIAAIKQECLEAFSQVFSGTVDFNIADKKYSESPAYIRVVFETENI